MIRATASTPVVFRALSRGRLLAPAVLAAAWLGAAPAHASTTLSTGDPATAFATSVLVDGLSQPTDIAELPDGRVVVTQRLGDVVVVNTNGDVVESGHITVVPEFQEQGLLGVVADPDFATNHTLYFYASVEPNPGGDPNNKHKVYHITLGDDGKLDSARDTTIANGLRGSRSSVDGGASNHNGGGLIIYKGQLYVSVGDTGHNKTPPTNHLATCLNGTNGKILRVNLDGTVPDNNPLSAESMVTGCTDWDQPLTMQAPEKRVFAWGLRNPYRFWIDPQTSRMWIGDVGETTREEISVGSPIDGDGAGSKGEHYGWPFVEGTHVYTTAEESYQPANSCMGVSPARACVPAVYDYGHTDMNNCVIGGLIPDGCGWAAPWNQRYFFGDNGSGRVWTADVNTNRDGIVSGSVKDFAKTAGIGSFRMGGKGVLYFAEVTGGLVTKITPKGLDTTMCMGSGAGGMGSGGGATGGVAGTGTGTGGTPASGGTTGGTATAGTTAGGGRTGTGGTPASGGSSGGTTPGSGGATTGGTGATGATGGATGATGGAATSGGTGGTPAATGGTAPSGGKSSTPPDSKDGGGCGCRVAGSGSGAAGLLALAGVLGFFGARRRNRRG